MKTREIKTDTYGIVPEDWMIEVPDISVVHKSSAVFRYINEYVEDKLDVDSLEFQDYLTLLTTYSLTKAMVDEEELADNVAWEKLLSELRRSLLSTEPIYSVICEAVEGSVLSWEEYERRCELNLSLQSSKNVNTILKSEMGRLDLLSDDVSSCDRYEELSLLQQQLEANLGSFDKDSYEHQIFLAEVVNHDLAEEAVELRANPIILRTVRPDLYDEDGKLSSHFMSECDAITIEKTVRSMSTWMDCSSRFQQQFQDMLSRRVDYKESVLKK